MTRPTLLQRANQWLLENPIGHGDSIRMRNASLLVTELRDALQPADTGEATPAPPQEK